MATLDSDAAPPAPGPEELSETDRAFTKELRQRVAESILPGEPELDDARLDEIAAFLLAAARQRDEDRAALLIRSAHGDRRFTRIAVVNRDMPFLVDSVSAAIAAHGLAIDLIVHPILPVRRDAGGRLTALPGGEGAGEKRESMIYLETPRVDAKERRALEGELLTAIADTRAANADWPRLRQLIGEDADRLADAEGAALLRWLGDGMMTHLGHLTRKRDGGLSDLLGICRKSARDLLSDASYDAAFAWFDGRPVPNGRLAAPGRAPLIIKANRLSLVHRRVPLDLFIVPLHEDGRVAALSVHAGLWTSAALSTTPTQVPVLRRQLETISHRLDFDPDGHDQKALIHALSTLPHDLIIGFSDDDITRVATAMMGIAERPRPRVSLVTAPLGRHLFAFVWLPRDTLSTQARLQIQDLLERQTGTSTLDWSLLVEGGNLALLRYVLDHRGLTATPDSAAIDARLQEMLRGWSDAVEHALTETEEPGRAAGLATRYAESFPAHYRGEYGPEEAARDISRLRRFAAVEHDFPLGRDVRLFRDAEGVEDRLRLKVYQHGGQLPLSDAVPALENFGFRVLSERPTELAGEAAMIHDFTLSLPPGLATTALLERAGVIEGAIAAVANGRAENDVFNRLVTSTGLSAQETDWLRAFYRYLRQVSIAYTIYTVVDALAGAPAVTRGLVDLFRRRHDPALQGDRAAAVSEAQEAIRAGLVEVTAINDDRLLRLYHQTMAAVLRTNAFAPAGAEALAFKLDSALVPGLPKPVPWREIFVYSRRVEGIHLRAGPVARGGLRWSDRRDDFRTEILGLMKAQRVKNAVIVPTGAKGGFYPKRLPNPAADRDAWFEEGRESYKLFIRTLLSVTDNIVGDKVVHPAHVLVHDGEDPYFVVAADKGTASFSDTANAIAEEHGFWLGDAFASGGSKGYDHKAMGITARGAWISVQRHFREVGVDVQADPVRVAGVGDMSGDVFGNGMLLSKAIRLVAAFDHRHIFLDPDPDAEASFAERQRLFDLPRSSWADYGPALISQGGGVFARTEKTIPLSPEVRAVLGIEDEALDPDSLIAAILKAPVDLMWFGGIGTYVKASGETHQQVGDPANDTLRVDGAELRAKVVGEGANLGVTQAGRIEFALHGGRINTDFIDNSAGVDCSDNEVNIKIALAAARRTGRLSEERRIAVLREMTDEVAELVLEDNRLQALALSIAEQGGARAVASQSRLIDVLEGMGELDRRTEGLADSQAFARRAAEGQGLTRPEVAVLLSNAKLVLQEAFEASDLAEDEAATSLLLGDFPPQMREHFRKPLLEHRLRREIVSTVTANMIVNRMGLVHPFELAEEEGASLAQVGCAFIAACGLFGMDATWEAIDSAQMPEAARLALFDRAAFALHGHMADLLRSGGCHLGPAQLQAELGDIVIVLRDAVDTLLGEEARGRTSEVAAGLVQAGAPEDLANEVARLYAMDGAVGIARLSHGCKVDPLALTRAFSELGKRLGLDWAQSEAATMNPSDPWERLLVAGLARDFQQMRLDFLRELGLGGRRTDIITRLEVWATQNEPAIKRFRAMVARAQGPGPVAVTALAQLASHARNLLKR
jgi:glutamate dehydrogenase